MDITDHVPARGARDLAAMTIPVGTSRDAVTHPVASSRRLKQRQQDFHYKCVVVGDGGVGKTSLLLRFVQGTFLEEYQPTDFDTFTITMSVGSEWTPCSMTLVDTAGQETYDRLRTLTYSQTDVFIVCFSTADRDSFTNVRARWLPELRQFQPKVPIVLVGTQADVRDQATGADLREHHDPASPAALPQPASSRKRRSDSAPSHVTTREGKRLASKISALVYAECSALTGTGLDTIFYTAMMAAAFPKRKRKLWTSFKRIFANR